MWCYRRQQSLHYTLFQLCPLPVPNRLPPQSLNIYFTQMSFASLQHICSLRPPHFAIRRARLRLSNLLNSNLATAHSESVFITPWRARPTPQNEKPTINDYFKMTTMNKIFIYDNINIFMIQINHQIPFEATFMPIKHIQVSSLLALW